MLSKFFKTQLKFPVRDDWTEQVKQDLQDFNIKEDFQWIKSMSKASFSKLVKRCGKEYALTELNKKKSTHSKLCNIEYDDLKLQAYLKCDNISVRQAHSTGATTRGLMRVQNVRCVVSMEIIKRTSIFANSTNLM